MPGRGAVGPALGLWRRHTLGLGFHGGGLRQLRIQLGSIVRGAWNKSDNVQWDWDGPGRSVHKSCGLNAAQVDRSRFAVARAGKRQVAGTAPVAPRHGRATAPGRTTVALTA